MSEVGARIRRARLAAGLTQGQLARQIEISGGYMGMLETGDRRLNEDVLRRLSKALGIPLSALLDDDAADAWQRGFEAGRASLESAITHLFATPPESTKEKR